jgi:hypothetical protein
MSALESPANKKGEREPVIFLQNKHHGMLGILVVTLLIGGIAANLALAQEKRLPQTSGVDDTKMGPYRALAQLAYEASQKGEGPTAAKLARVLERTWDKAEDYGGDMALSKTNHTLFEQIDKAMDQFITLLQHASPERNAVQSAYNAYLEKLKLAD